MKNKLISGFGILLGAAVFATGCGDTSLGEGIEIEDIAPSEDSVEQEAVTESVSGEAAAEVESSSEKSAGAESSFAEGAKGEAGYDRSFLKEKGGVYTYSLTDPELIAKYDELYADAFVSVVKSYKEVAEFKDQSYDDTQSAVVGDLLYKGTEENSVMNTGSYYEMDYGFDLNNVGYTYVDLDSDGTYEIIFGVLKPKYDDWGVDCFERAFALVDGKVVKFCEGGSRDLHWLGNDGYIYETGSCGAANWGTWRLHFNSSALPKEDMDWGSNGFTDDEFLGMWGEPGSVHIVGPIEDLDKAAAIPENQLAEGEWEALNEEWESRRVKIEWLTLSDYLKEHKELLG
ncbi:hypothetical protein D6853_05760 [Butyrivibrio sp. X503]|uniref:hypothetical protein n=1 Tax=Butyrivibrio sp. X503 TaxID=2364878 RepID=UPI000EA8FF7C|nr:hypothetical protein [Butyrivibrio sp. X503]RKM56300.1 hypothetical protein D6853_05760 [Butyrivibrio sp. X503]